MVVTAAPNGYPAAAEPTLTRAEINRRNSQRSTGPRTETGKRRSSLNAPTRGLTSQSPLLPGEDPVEHAASRRECLHNLQPRNKLEAMFADRIADAMWGSTRAGKAAAAQLEYDLRNRPLEQAAADREQVIECGARMLHDLAVATAREIEDRLGGPGHPARLLATLEQTVAGCDWLLGRFGRLSQHLRTQNAWTKRDGYELVRLHGHFIGDLNQSDDVAAILVLSESVATESLPSADDDDDDDKPADHGVNSGQPAEAAVATAANRSSDTKCKAKSAALERTFRLILGVFDAACMDRRDATTAVLKRFVPPNVEVARSQLTQVIDAATRRLEQIRALRVQIDQANAADLAVRLAAAPTREASLQHRRLLTHAATAQQHHEHVPEHPHRL